ncbi:MAG TPA: hypothetical protein VMH61_00365 [Candidatus Acidoferrales bacterium]|nr:hypothetical protein [Candidatus Acidoferrales bacterium]
MTSIVRETRETRVEIRLAPGAGTTRCRTGLRFLDHMMTTLAATAGLEMELTARGDLRHHVIEDVALATGEAVARLLPERPVRYGERTLAMDDALVQVALDLGGRAYYRGPLPAPLYDHWMRSFATQARATLHVRVLRGRDRHHVIEAAFKALGFALRDALASSGAGASTKGAVRWEDGAC